MLGDPRRFPEVLKIYESSLYNNSFPSKNTECNSSMNVSVDKFLPTNGKSKTLFLSTVLVSEVLQIVKARK